MKRRIVGWPDVFPETAKDSKDVLVHLAARADLWRARLTDMGPSLNVLAVLRALPFAVVECDDETVGLLKKKFPELTVTDDRPLTLPELT